MGSGNFDFLLVFFIYGLAFFCMGLIMLIESRRSSVLGEARLLIPLAIFGFIHGTHEWVEMFLVFRNWLGLPVPPAATWWRLFLLVVSFSFLLFFALQALKPQHPRLPARAVYTAAGLLVLTAVMAVGIGIAQNETPIEWDTHTDALARYILAVPAALLAAFGLVRQSQQSRRAGRSKIAVGMLVAGLSFGMYSLTQMVVSPANIFPARYINSVVFYEWLGVPIQGVRAAVAVLATLGLTVAIQAAEDDRRRQLVTAQQSRLEALQLIQRDLEEREIMRRDLLRHTVIAQEDERRRIARELHDETSQYLTALSLNMAALRNTLSEERQAGEILERLQELSRRMSQGIYRMVHDLRPAQLDDLGLAAALQYLADDTQRRSGLLVLLQVQGVPRRLDPLIETVLFRVAQEALNNVARHSQSDDASLQLEFGLEEVRLRVQDNGIGFDPDAQLAPPRGWGIAGMRERAESMGGKLNLRSTPGKGTLVEVILAISESNASHIEEGDNEPNPLTVS
jgi:signal transduction histidine kinase